METADEQNFRVVTGIGPVTDRILNGVLDKLSSREFKEKLNDKLIDPLTQIVNEKMQPYIYASLALYSIVIILLLIIIYFVVIKKQK